MATTAGFAMNTILRRVRDPGGTAHPQALVLDLISRAQTAINCKLALVTEEADLVLQPMLQVYAKLSLSHPRIARVVSVHDGSRELDPIDWARMQHFSGTWWRRSGDEPQCWGMIGRDALLVHPGLDREHTVTLTYALCPPPLTQLDDELIIPDQSIPLVYDAVEALLLNRQLSDENTFELVYSRGIGRFDEQSQRTGSGPSTLGRASGPSYM